MKTARLIAVPSLIGATWLAMAAGTLIQFAALGGALSQIDGATQDNSLHDEVVVHVGTEVR